MSTFNENGRISIDDPDLGQFELSVPDFNKPEWFGKFQTGKLSIYLAKQHGTPLLPCYGLVYVISGQDDPSLDSMGFTLYYQAFPLHAAVTHLTTLIEKEYLDLVVKSVAANSPTYH